MVVFISAVFLSVISPEESHMLTHGFSPDVYIFSLVCQIQYVKKNEDLIPFQSVARFGGNSFPASQVTGGITDDQESGCSY